MLQIGPYIIDENKLSSKDVIKKLSILPKEELAYLLINAHMKIIELEELNTTRFVNGMLRKTSSGGVTIDE